MAIAEHIDTTDLPAPDDFLQVLGGVLTLADQSDLHRQYDVAQLTSRIVPALLTGQFRYYDDKATGQPVAFVCWAMTTPEGYDLLAEGESPDDIDQWISGDQLVFVEFLAPHGGVANIRQDLAVNVFADGTVGVSFRPLFDEEGEFTGMQKKIWRFDQAKDAGPQDRVEEVRGGMS